MMDNNKFIFEKICDKYTEEIRNNSVSPRQSHGDIIVHPPGCVLPLPFQDAMDRIYNFKIYPDDTWVVTFPKCGTTWTQELVWLLKNNFDFHKARSVPLPRRFPFFEFEKIMSIDDPNLEPVPSTLELTENLPRPRCIKSHLPMGLLPKQLWTVMPKIIYVARDPRDVAISYYHHMRLFNGYRGTLENYIDVFLNDKVVYGPYWSHLFSYLDLENKSHILFNTYEEMKKDLASVIKKTAKFLNVNISDKQIEALKQHLSFESMKQNKALNYEDAGNEAKKRSNITDENLTFIRKGESGNWKSVFGKEILEKFKVWNEFHLKNRNFKEYLWS